MSLYKKIHRLNEQFSATTAPEPGATTHAKLKDFHDALTTALHTLTLLTPEEFNDPRIQTFLESTLSLKCNIKLQLDQIHIDEFMKNACQ